MTHLTRQSTNTITDILLVYSHLLRLEGEHGGSQSWPSGISVKNTVRDTQLSQ